MKTAISFGIFQNNWPIAVIPGASMDLVNRKPLKFQNRLGRKFRVSRLPLICIIQHGIRLDSAVPTFQLALFFRRTI